LDGAVAKLPMLSRVGHRADGTDLTLLEDVVEFPEESVTPG
jgi:hypothetical protein